MADQSLSVQYEKNRKTADQAELERWAAEQMAQPDVLGPPTPEGGAAKTAEAKPAEGASSIASKAGTAFWDTLTEGTSNFVAGLANRPKSVMDLEGAGQQVLGVMQMLSALPAGAGAAFKQALKVYKPGMEEAVAIKGGKAGETTTAGIVRSILGAPIAMKLDPKLKAAIEKDPTPFAEALNEDMTYGELADIFGQFVGIPLTMKTARAVVGKAKSGAAAPEVKVVQGEVVEPQRATLALPERATQEPLVTPPPAESSAFETRIRAAQMEGPEAYARVVAEELRTALEDAPPRFSEVLREKYRGAPEDVPPTAAAGAATPEATATPATPAAPPTDLPSALDVALKRSEQVIAEEGLGGEKGTVDTGLLARMALGAAAGGSQGDTPEERIRNAFLGMGLGAAMSGKLATRLKDVYKESSLADESGALNFDRFRKKPAVQASEQAFQPNYQRIDATPEVKSLMKNIHRMMKEDILEKRGPARTNDLRVKEALDLIDTGKMTPERVLTLGDKEMLADSDYTAARILSVRAFQHVSELRTKINAGEVMPEGTLKQSLAVAGAMSRNVLVARKRIAQAQQSGSIRVSGEGVGYRPEDVAHLVDSIEPGMTDAQLAKALGHVKTQDQMEKVGVWTVLFPRMVVQGIYGSYLSGKASLKNIVGNTVMMAEAPIDVGIGRFMPRWGTGATKQGIVPGEATQMARTMGETLIETVKMMRHWDDMETAAAREGVDVARIGMKTDRRQPAGRAFAEGLAGENSPLTRVGDWYDKGTMFFSNVLEQTDLGSKFINSRMAHKQEAFRQATQEGHKGDAFETRVTELMDDVSQLSDTARERITDFADSQTFTRDLEGRMTRALAHGPDNEWLNLAYRGFIMPFFRITANMTDATFARLPVLNLASKQFWQDFNAGGARQQVAQARVARGAAMVGAFMYMESQGTLTGNAPKDPGKRRFWENAGYKARTINGVSYDGLGPLTSMIAGAADTSLTLRNLPTDSATVLPVFWAYLMSQINTIDSRSFTQSVSNFTEVVTAKNSDTQIEKGMEFLRRQMAGWLKPGAVKEIESVVDPEIRRAKRSGAYQESSLEQEAQAFLDDVRSAWPGFSSEKDGEGNYLVPPDRDRITGKPTIVTSWPFNPFPESKMKDVPVRKPDGTMTGISQEIARLNGAGLDGWPEWLGHGKPTGDPGLTEPKPTSGVRLTPQERERYQILFTQEVKNGLGQTYAEALKATMQDPAYWEASDGKVGTDGGKARMLQRIDREFEQLAEEALYMIGRSAEGQPGALERSILEKEAERRIQRVPTAEQPEIRGAVQDTLKNLRGLPSTLSR